MRQLFRLIKAAVKKLLVGCVPTVGVARVVIIVSGKKLAAEDVQPVKFAEENHPGLRYVRQRIVLRDGCAASCRLREA